MGIAVCDLLNLEYFRDFEVLAGRKGLSKEIQGIAVLEAPDATRWVRGKEMILSSGYVIKQEPECIKVSFDEGRMQKASAFVLKRDRHLNPVPEDLIRLFEEHDIPLISMPFTIPWMELMSQINTAVMNQTIRRFQIYNDNVMQISDQSYKDRKIQKILQAVEAEMHFPAFVYDFIEEKSYTSSPNFQTYMNAYGLAETDFWNPPGKYTKYTLCDNIEMARIRLQNIDPENEGPRISWIIIPIKAANVVQAYFVVMEALDLMDYYDEFSIRIAYLTLQGIYEQIMVAQSVGNVGFENFVHFVMNDQGRDPEKLTHQANMQGLSVNSSYIYILFQQKNSEIIARKQRDAFVFAMQQCGLGKSAKLAFLDDNEGLFLINFDVVKGEKDPYQKIYEILTTFTLNAQKKNEDLSLQYGVYEKEAPLLKMHDCVEICRKINAMGEVIYPRDRIWNYRMLGPLTWLQIPEEELLNLLSSYQELASDEKTRDLIKTLKVYLENNLNYSMTAEKMYVHINTIRKRIDRIQSMIDIDFDDYIDRMKAEILLQFLEFGE